jgi:hypothetical protein
VYLFGSFPYEMYVVLLQWTYKFKCRILKYGLQTDHDYFLPDSFLIKYSQFIVIFPNYSAFTRWYLQMNQIPWRRALLAMLIIGYTVKELPCHLWNPKVHYHFHKIPLVRHILSLMNKFYRLTIYFFRNIYTSFMFATDLKVPGSIPGAARFSEK